MNLGKKMNLAFRKQVSILWMPLIMLPGTAFAEPTLELRISGTKEVFAGDPETTSVDAYGVIGAGPVMTKRAAFDSVPVVSLSPGRSRR